MDFTFTEEQERLRAGVRRLFDERARPRDCYGGKPGIDGGLWSALAEMGVAGLGIDAGDLIDQVAVAEEIGRALAPIPFLSTTVVAGPLLGPTKYRDPITSGELVAVAALDDPTTRVARTHESGWRLTGRASFVIDGPAAHLILMGAPTSRGTGIFAIARDSHGVTITDLPALDRTRGLADVELDGAPAELLCEDDGDALAAARARGEVGIAAEAVGVAARALEMAAEYAKVRRQFGTPIGTFQAVKHRLADMLVAVENARSAVAFGAFALAGTWPDAPVAVAMAISTATESAVHVAGDALQIFGGIGCTWEHDIHLYLRRAKSAELLLGEPAAHLERIASFLLDRPEEAVR